MPTYTITDPQSGKKIKITGDSPPSESELEEIFSSAKADVPRGTKSITENVGEALVNTGNLMEEIRPKLAEGLPIAGAIGGAYISKNPIGGVLGYMGGKYAERAIQNKPTEAKDVPSDVNEAMIQEILSGLPGYLKPYISKMAGKFSRKITPEMVDKIKLSEETGVPLTPGEITQSKPTMLIESHLDKNIATAGESQSFRKKQFNAVNNLKELLQKSIGGKKLPLEAGQLAQESGKSNQAKWMNQAQKYYDAVPIDPEISIETPKLRDVAIGHLDELGKMGQGSVKRILKIAEGSMDQGTKLKMGTPDSSILMEGNLGRTYNTTRGVPAEGTRPPGGYSMKFTTEPAGTGGIVDASGNPFVGANMPTYTWKELTADRAEINKIIRTTADPNKRRILHDVVNAIDDDIASFSEKNSPEVKQAFDKATSFYREGAKIFRDRQISNTLKSANPEDIVKNFIKPNNVSEIRRLSSAVGEDGISPIKQAWLERLVTKGDEQTFSPAKFSTSFEKYDIDTLKSFLKPNEIAGLQKLSKVSKLLESVEKIAGNPSGTGQTGMTAATIVSMAKHPIFTATAMIGSKKFAKNYFTNPEFRRTFLYGISISPKSSETSKLAARLMSLSGINDTQEDLISQETK